MSTLFARLRRPHPGLPRPRRHRLAAAPAFAAEEVTIYTTREPGLIQLLLTAFSTQSGVKANTVFIKDGLLERVKAEAPALADVLMTVDIGNLMDLSRAASRSP